MIEILKDPMFFYSIAFAIILWLAYRYGRKPTLQMLDDQISEIRNELDRARKLRAEAEAMLADYKARYAAAMSEAETIIKHAKEEAEKLKVQAEIDIKNALARHEQQAIGRIQMAEAAATTEVRTAAVDLAMKMARETLSSSANESSATKILDKAIAELPSAPAVKAA